VKQIVFRHHRINVGVMSQIHLLFMILSWILCVYINNCL